MHGLNESALKPILWGAAVAMLLIMSLGVIPYEGITPAAQ